MSSFFETTYLHPRRAKRLLKEKIFRPIISHYTRENNYLTPQTVALVTGGANGLGLAIVNELLMWNISKVVIVDVATPSSTLIEDPRVTFYQCDISSFEKVVELYARVKSECGAVSLIINNAGVTSIATLTETSEERIEQVFKVNFFGSRHIVNLFLPDLLESTGGYLINVASILGEVTPARLIAYGSSKGALIGFHEALFNGHRNSTEQDLSRVKMLLVCPGKLETTMFRQVRTPSSIFAPDVKVDCLAFLIVQAVRNGKTGFLRLPYYTNILPLFEYLDWPYIRICKRMSGMNKATDIECNVKLVKNS